MAVASDGPNWSSIGFNAVSGPEVLQVVLCDLAVQTSAEQTTAHPAKRLNGSSVPSRDHLSSKRSRNLIQLKKRRSKYRN